MIYYWKTLLTIHKQMLSFKKDKYTKKEFIYIFFAIQVNPT